VAPAEGAAQETNDVHAAAGLGDVQGGVDDAVVDAVHVRQAVVERVQDGCEGLAVVHLDDVLDVFQQEALGPLRRDPLDKDKDAVGMLASTDGIRTDARRHLSDEIQDQVETDLIGNARLGIKETHQLTLCARLVQASLTIGGTSYSLILSRLEAAHFFLDVEAGVNEPYAHGVLDIRALVHQV
jgi:hypothetical protein